jgi:glutathione synthase/RimK-type ligase-like ATP-grasp enzyme
MILILGDYEDPHAVHMQTALRQRGADCEILDSRWFPRDLSIWYDPVNEQGEFLLPNDTLISFDDVRSVYWRSYHEVFPPELPDEQQSYIAANDSRSLFESILIRLPARWVNGWQAFQSHQTKPAQLAEVARLQIPVPATVLTNEPEEVIRFVKQHGRAIFKPVQGGAHTRRLTREQLTEQALAHLALAPITLQAEVPGTNIRAFVIGEQVLACEIETRKIDFRDDPDPIITEHLLPDFMQTQCRKIANTLHLCWSGIDFRLNEQGEYVFLEANPSPMFLGFEEAAGLPLTQALADLLLHGPRQAA